MHARVCARGRMKEREKNAELKIQQDGRPGMLMLMLAETTKAGVRWNLLIKPKELKLLDSIL